MKIINFISVLVEEVENNSSWFTAPRIIALCAIGVAVICLLFILIKYLVKDRYKKIEFKPDEKNKEKEE